MVNCSICNSDATLCSTCLTGFYLNYAGNGCVKDCKEDSNHLLNKAQTKCVANCLTDDSALLAITKDKCVSTCGTDIKNYASTECIYLAAGCSTLDEYAYGTSTK